MFVAKLLERVLNPILRIEAAFEISDIFFVSPGLWVGKDTGLMSRCAGNLEQLAALDGFSGERRRRLSMKFDRQGLAHLNSKYEQVKRVNGSTSGVPTKDLGQNFDGWVGWE